MDPEKSRAPRFIYESCHPLTLVNDASSVYRSYFKRLIDLSGSVVLLFSLSWLWLAIILLYAITFQFPIFFRQKRIGRQGKPFSLLKFRTLKDTDDDLLHRQFFPGNLLRATSLDELPQLGNVLKGDMSLIGPRPLPVRYLPLFSVEQSLRHSVRPGITGWAQVNGRHGITWPEKFGLDLYYIRHLSFRLDVAIVIKTLRLLFSFRPDVSLHEKEFRGEQ